MKHAFVEILEVFQQRLITAGTSVGDRVYLDRIDALTKQEIPAYVIEFADVRLLSADSEGYSDHRERYTVTVAVYALVSLIEGCLPALWQMVAEAKPAFNGIHDDLEGADDVQPAGFGPVNEALNTAQGKLAFVPILFNVTVSLAESDHTTIL